MALYTLQSHFKLLPSVFTKSGICNCKDLAVFLPLSRSLNSVENNQTLPPHARVVICGAGVVGTSVAYHLVQKGWTDVLVLDQNTIGSGTSWHGPGLVCQFKPTSERSIVSYSAKLYEQLQDQGYDIGWRKCGSLNVAQSKDRWISLKRFFSQTRACKLECELYTARDIQKAWPYLKTDDLQGGVWLPSDGIADTYQLCKTLADLAKTGGVHYVENCKVEEVLTSKGSVSAVNTNLGKIQCEYFVNCAGLWAHDLGQKCSIPVRIPVHAAQHSYMMTKPFQGEETIRNLPIVQDYDGRVYLREWNGGLLAGGFEKFGKPVFHYDTPTNFEFKLLPEDWEHFQPLYKSLVKRIPLVASIEVQHLQTGPENFTPDGKWIIGESPDVKNYFVGCGMNGNSIMGAGGIGKALADWIISGEPTIHLFPFDIKRFMELHNNKKFLRERIKEIAGRHYTLNYPLQNEFRFARKLRCSPLYTVQEAAGAVFGERMGFERALYFDINHKVGGEPAHMSAGTFGKPRWFEFIKDEYMTCRSGVGLIDLSSLTKIELESAGTEVVDFLQILCSNDIDIPVGSIVQTGMQNEQGGYENDCILVRRAENHYFMISPTIQHTRIKDWVCRHLPYDGSISFSDVTSKYTVLNVVGPKSKELMVQITNTDMIIHPFTYKEVSVGYASDIMVMGFTNAGEPGYSLYIPSEYALHVYDRLMETGRDYGLRNVGYFALRCLRIEKFISFWGEEISSVTTPYELGRGYKVKLQKDYFLGKSELMKQHEKGVARRLVHFVLEDHNLDSDIWPWGREPIFRNGHFVGMTTSAGYGFTLEQMACMGFVQHHNSTENESFIVPNDYITSRDAHFEIEIAGKRFAAKGSLHPPTIPLTTLDTVNQRYIPKARQTLMHPKR